MSLEQVLKNNEFCSASYLRLAKLLVSEPKLANLEFNYQSELIEPFMHTWSHSHTVSPWPCIVEKALVGKIEKLVRTIPPLIYKAMKLCLKADDEKFCEYLNVSSLVRELFEYYVLEVADLPIRYDAIIHKNIIKLVEINCGAALGGWQMDYLEREVFESLKKIPESASWNIKHRSICLNTIRSISQSIVRNKGLKAKGNILFFMPDAYPEGRKNSEKNFNELYEKVRPSQYPRGKLFFISDLSELEITDDGNVLFQNEVMDAVLLTVEKGNEVPEFFYNKIQSASLSGKFYYPDNSNFSLMGNKLAFGLLHEPEIQAQLTSEERELVELHIPWSAKLASEIITFKNQNFKTLTFLRENKKGLVIKKSNSMQGKDVFVGKMCRDEEWDEAISAYRNDNDWLIQQYCEPDLVVGADSNNGIGNFRMVWGFFSCAARYSGCFLRGVREQSDSAVINSANGAIEFLVFEEQQLANKIVL